MVQVGAVRKLRARTTCVYCGTRISGSDHSQTNTHNRDRDRWMRRAAKLACRDHIRIALNDHHYEDAIYGS